MDLRETNEAMHIDTGQGSAAGPKSLKYLGKECGTVKRAGGGESHPTSNSVCVILQSWGLLHLHEGTRLDDPRTLVTTWMLHF